MLERIFGENWAIIVPLIGAAVAWFFPQLKPIIDKFTPTPPTPVPPVPPAPVPPAPAPVPVPPTPFFPPTPVPQPNPQPAPSPEDFAQLVAALQQLVRWFKLTKNEAGEKAVRTAGRALFNEAKSEE